MDEDRSIPSRATASVNDDQSSGNLRDRQKRQRRTQILDAAEALFNEKGFDGSTIGEIAALANVSAATIHNYYQGKGELLLALVARTDNDIRAHMEEVALGEPKDPHLAINRVLAMITIESLETLEHHVWRHAIATSIIRENMEFGIGFAETHRRFVVSVSHVVRALIDTGALAPDIDVQVLSSVLYKIHHALFVELIAESSPNTKRYLKIQEAHVAHVLRGLTQER